MRQPDWVETPAAKFRSSHRQEVWEILGSICPDQTKQLSNNKELYDYLVDLSATLRKRGAESLASIVYAASRHAVGLSTEFLGESRIALRKVSDSDQSVLSETERAEITDVLNQLSSALDRRHTQR